MRHLLLLRHAKAEPAGGSQADHDRHLTDRGRRDAAMVGRLLTAGDRAPDRVLTSTAARALETAELAHAAGGWTAPLVPLRELYGASIGDAVAALRREGGRSEVLLAVGHEPTWSELASALAGGGRLRLPTAGLVHLSFDLDAWAGLALGRGVLRGLLAPSLLRSSLPPG